MLAITLETAKNTAIVILIVLVVVAIVVARFVASVTIKAISLLILGALALGVWTQRASLVDCADKVEATGSTTGATCRFFGSDINIKAP